MAVRQLPRREFLALTAIGFGASRLGPLEPRRMWSGSVPEFELDEATVESLQKGMTDGRYTARGGTLPAASPSSTWNGSTSWIAKGPPFDR
jgi:hypothetical protein